MSLGEIQSNLDRMMSIIDETEEITDQQIDEFFALKAKREEKVDGWIAYRDQAKAFVATLEERKKRFVKAHKAAKRVLQRINERIKYHLENDRTGLAFRGAELGTLYLHTNAQSVVCDVDTEDKTVYGVVSDVFDRTLLADYLKEKTFTVLDKTKLKIDLLAGRELTWARLEQGSHVRVKG